MVAALDMITTTEDDTREEIRAHLQKQNTLRNTGGLESVLLLHESARMLFYGKDSPILGLMNGAEVEIVSIELDAEDRLVLDHRKDDGTKLIVLRKMPGSVLVRAIGAKWVLPNNLLPTLPEEFDRRGLFIVKPQRSNKFKVMHEGFKYGVCRIQLLSLIHI